MPTNGVYTDEDLKKYQGSVSSVPEQPIQIQQPQLPANVSNDNAISSLRNAEVAQSGLGDEIQRRLRNPNMRDLASTGKMIESNMQLSTSLANTAGNIDQGINRDTIAGVTSNMQVGEYNRTNRLRDALSTNYQGMLGSLSEDPIEASQQLGMMTAKTSLQYGDVNSGLNALQKVEQMRRTQIADERNTILENAQEIRLNREDKNKYSRLENAYNSELSAEYRRQDSKYAAYRNEKLKADTKFGTSMSDSAIEKHDAPFKEKLGILTDEHTARIEEIVNKYRHQFAEQGRPLEYSKSKPVNQEKQQTEDKTTNKNKKWNPKTQSWE